LSAYTLPARVQFHAKTGFVRQEDVTVGVWDQGFGDHALEEFDGEGGGFLEEFDVGGVGTGGAEVEVGGDTETATAVVGGEGFVVQLGVGGDFFEATETGGDAGVGLEDVVAVLVDQQAEFVETDVVFTTRDWNIGRGGEAPEIVEFEATEGFLHPGDVEVGKFATGGESAVEAPDEVVFAAGGTGFLGLIGVDHDFHAVADSGANSFDLGDVFLHRGGVEAEFDGSVTEVEEAESILGALFW
jgi:hypothetical protein